MLTLNVSLSFMFIADIITRCIGANRIKTDFCFFIVIGFASTALWFIMALSSYHGYLAPDTV